MKTRAQLFLIVLALGIAYLGVHYRVPAIVALVGVGVSLYALVGGVRMIITRRADVPTGSGPNAYIERHTGIAALLWGILFVFYGVVGTAISLAFWLWPAEKAARTEPVVLTPLMGGLGMVITGMALGVFGASRLTARREAFVETRLNAFEQYIQGVGYTLTGAVIVTIGLLLIFAPGVLVFLKQLFIAWVTRMANG